MWSFATSFVLVVILDHALCSDVEGNSTAPSDDASSNVKVEDIQSQEHVDLKRYTGMWYEVSRTRSFSQFSSMESVIRYFSLVDERRSSTAYFSASINGTCIPAWTVLIQQRCAEGRGDYFARMLTPPTPWGISKVLYTDYTSVALQYFCEVLKEDGTCMPGESIATVVSRKLSGISIETDQYVKEVLRNKTGISPADLAPTQHEVDCMPQILAALSPGNDDCVVSEIQVQVNFNMDRFSGRWFPIAANRFVPHPDLVSSPMCYTRSGTSSLTVSHITTSENKCQSASPFEIIQKCPSAGLGDFLVNKGIPLSPGHEVFSFFKLLYTDYDVAVGYGCLAITSEGTCVQNFTGAAILSRTTEISLDRREVLNDYLRQACIDPDSLRDASFSEEERHCGCPDDLSSEDDDGDDDDVGEDCAVNDVMLGGKFQGVVETTILGQWYDLAGTPAIKNRFIPGMDSMMTYYRLGSHNTLQATFVAAVNGVCITPMVSISQAACEDEKVGLLLTSLPPPRYTSWYLFWFIYADDEVLISSQCTGDQTCDILDHDVVRVIGRSPHYDNVTQERVNAVLERLCIDPGTLSPSGYSVDCSHKLFEELTTSTDTSTDNANSTTIRTCPMKTRDIPMQVNLTMPEWVGQWHVVSANFQFNELLLLASMMIYHKVETDGSTSVHVSGQFQDGACLPAQTMKVRPRCEDDPFGEMWMTRRRSPPDSILSVAATAKTIYSDGENLVMYSCDKERTDGTCEPNTARPLILGRNWEISDEKRSELKEQVTKACLDPADLMDTAGVLGGDCREEFNKMVREN